MTIATKSNPCGALANAAIRHGHTALYLRAPRMLDEMTIARADGRLVRLMAGWARVSVLVLDDLLVRPLNPDQAADLLEVIDDRVGVRSTIVTSQLPIANWHETMGDETIADAVLDRLLEKAHRIELAGESMRRGADSSGRSGSSGSAPDADTSSQATQPRRRATKGSTAG